MIHIIARDEYSALPVKGYKAITAVIGIETEVSLANLAVKFAGLEISLANRLKWCCSVCYYTNEIRLEN